MPWDSPCRTSKEVEEGGIGESSTMVEQCFLVMHSMDNKDANDKLAVWLFVA